MSIWDTPEFAAGTGEFIKFSEVGDKVAGTVESIGKKTWDDGSVSPQIELVTDDGEPKTLTAGQVRLKAALAEQRPEVGDHITVELTEIQKRPGGKTLKVFKVDVKRATAAAASASVAADDEPPF
jgi:hypothetical protein